MEIQKGDGSFDEFYPNERGWAGPTGFLLYAMIDSYRLLGDGFPDELKDRFFTACEKAAKYLIRWDEPGVLANHHAMAVLPVFEAARLLDTRSLWKAIRPNWMNSIPIATRKAGAWSTMARTPAISRPRLAFSAKSIGIGKASLKWPRIRGCWKP